MTMKFTLSLILLLTVSATIFADCPLRPDIIEDCKVENCEQFVRYGVLPYEGFENGYTVNSVFGHYSDTDFTATDVPGLNYTEWIPLSSLNLNSSESYHEQFYLELIETGTGCQYFYSGMQYDRCLYTEAVLEDTLRFSVPQNSSIQLDINPSDVTCSENCFIEFSLDRMGSVSIEDGCSLEYTPGNGFCGEEYLQYYYINDSGEALRQIVEITVACDPIDFDVFVEPRCDKDSGEIDFAFIHVGLNDGQQLEWRNCNSDTWSPMNFVEITPGYYEFNIVGLDFFDGPFCFQYRDPANPDAIATYGPDYSGGCPYFPGPDYRFEVTEEFICDYADEEYIGIVSILSTFQDLGKIYWKYCDCPDNADTDCNEWKLGTALNDEMARIVLPSQGFDEHLCIQVVSADFPFVIETKDYGVSLCENSLAIDLLNFEGATKDKANEIFWQVATEDNVDYYILENSKDGIHFSEMGKVKSQGLGNTVMEYTFLDNDPKPINYYRLVSVDNLGNEEIVSDIIRLEQNRIIDAQIFPNPTMDYFEVSYNSSTEKEVHVEIVDVVGKVLVSRNVKLFAGINQIKLDLIPYPMGTYLLKIEDENLIFVRKVLKNR